MSAVQGSLFDLEPAPPAPDLSPDARRKARQADAIRDGAHPLSAALWPMPPIALHPLASRVPQRTANNQIRCGSCKFTERNERGYLKCTARDGIRVSRGPGTDLRMWWPGCTDWEEAHE